MTAWTLCTEQDVRDIQTMPSTIPESWSEMVEGMIREHTGLTKLGLTSEEFTEYRSGDNSTFLRLKNSPVQSVSSLTIDGVAVSSTDYVVGTYYVQLLSGVFSYGVRNVVITYSAGDGEVDPDIRLAASMMLVAVNNYFGRGGADASIKWTTLSGSEKGGEQSKLGLADHLNGIMKATIRQKRIKIG